MCGCALSDVVLRLFFLLLIVCVRMCTFMFLSLTIAYIHHAYMHTRIHAYVHTYMRTCVHACLHACVHAYIQRMSGSVHGCPRVLVCSRQRLLFLALPNVLVCLA